MDLILNKAVKALIVIVLITVTGASTIILDALFRTGDTTIDIICRNNENVRDKVWREMGEHQCESIKELLTFLKSFVNHS